MHISFKIRCYWCSNPHSVNKIGVSSIFFENIFPSGLTHFSCWDLFLSWRYKTNISSLELAGEPSFNKILMIYWVNKNKCDSADFFVESDEFKKKYTIFQNIATRISWDKCALVKTTLITLFIYSHSIQLEQPCIKLE